MPSRFSDIAHAGMLLWNPLPEDETLRVVDGLRLAATARVLDVGCGRAELLLRLLARTGASGVGIDVWPPAAASARDAARGRVDPSRFEIREERFDAANFAEGSFDVAMCVGSTHAAGGLRETLRAFRRLLVPGGVALVGEGHWIREPDAAYLAFLGSPRESLLDHAGNVAAARDEGFDVVRELVTSLRDFDRYEDRYAANVERFAAGNPHDPDAAAFLARIREWRAAYLQWGRRTLGFALYELQRR
jgi:SAM-dependent methyltransferase